MFGQNKPFLRRIFAATALLSAFFLLKCSQPTQPKSDYYAVRAKISQTDSLCYFLVRKDTLFPGKELALSGWGATVLDAQSNSATLSFVSGNGKASTLAFPEFNALFVSGCGNESALLIGNARKGHVEVSIYQKATSSKIR